MKILLVEDNHSDASLFMELVAECKDPPSVHWVTDGYEALDFFLSLGKLPPSEHPDVVLLDLGLPRISGYDVMLKLKSHPQHAKIPIVVLTTSRSPLDYSQCEKLGCKATLSKPSNLHGYREMVEQLVNNDFPKMLDEQKGGLVNRLLH